MMKFSLLYVTTKNKSEALSIGRALVEQRLAACVNVLNPMSSIYHWEGRIHEGEEAVLIAKTKKTLVPEVIEKVKALHSYECPCVVELTIEQGNADFLKWIEDSTL